ncbi:MAG: hypothetical protein M0Z43_06000 [Acidithiobacillus sp.]|nr:hypothetical protein [Acidithiobacillus sp.]
MSTKMKSVAQKLAIIFVAAGGLAVISQMAGWDFGPYQAVAAAAIAVISDALHGLIAKNALAAKK